MNSPDDIFGPWDTHSDDFTQFAATSRGMLLAGKMVNGLAIGCLFATATAWASEISAMRLRGQSNQQLLYSCFSCKPSDL